MTNTLTIMFPFKVSTTSFKIPSTKFSKTSKKKKKKKKTPSNNDYVITFNVNIYNEMKIICKCYNGTTHELIK